MLSPLLVVMRGVPGSGKSTYIRRYFPSAAFASADSFFNVDGVYRFNPAKLSEAHGACFKLACEQARLGTDLIAIDNTSITIAEIAPYVLLAQAYNYRVNIITLLADPYVAAARNTHGVPIEQVVRMDTLLRKVRLMGWWPHMIVNSH